ncbi:MAG: hypothetical protein IJX30_03260 [Clostridia bacterium]|nr:hypothetical protein [Clostridia bacterium]
MHLTGFNFDDTTFGMDIESNTSAYRNFKKSVKREMYTDRFGREKTGFVVPYLNLGAIMGRAHFLVTEKKSFLKIQIDGYLDGADIYVKYAGELADFSRK